MTTQTTKAQAKNNMSTIESFTILALIFFWPLGLLMALLFCHRFLKKTEFWICLVIWSSLTTGIYRGVRGIITNIAEQRRIEQEIIATERGRDYYINFNSTNIKKDSEETPYLEADCHLKFVSEDKNELSDDATPLEVYKHNAHDLVCSSIELEGMFSDYETVDFHAELADGKLSTVDLNGQTFTVSATKPAFSKSDWEREELERPASLTSTLSLYLTNSRLNSEKMLTYNLRIKYRLSDEDYKLLEENQVAYQTYKAAEAERIAKEEQARKEEEERKQKEKEEEEKRIAKEEAEKKAKEEAAQAAAAQQAAASKQPAQSNTTKPATTTQTTSKPASSTQATNKQPTTSSSSSTTTSKPASSSSAASKPATSSGSTTQNTTESSNLPLKAICKDGTVSYQNNASLPNYRGMCSGHGGIKTKLGRVP